MKRYLLLASQQTLQVTVVFDWLVVPAVKMLLSTIRKLLSCFHVAVGVTFAKLAGHGAAFRMAREFSSQLAIWLTIVASDQSCLS